MTQKVSVIIPTYNGADLLPRAIDSVLNQTYKDFNIVNSRSYFVFSVCKLKSYTQNRV